MKYVFRVKSVSHAGNSSYSEESEPILVKAAISEDSTHGGAAIASGMNKSFTAMCSGTEASACVVSLKAKEVSHTVRRVFRHEAA